MAKQYIEKLVKYNLNHPINQRIAMGAIEERRNSLPRIVSGLKIFTQAHLEVDPKIEAKNKLWDSLTGRTMDGREFQNYVNEPGCSRLPVYQIGTIESGLESNNSIGHKLLKG